MRAAKADKVVMDRYKAWKERAKQGGGHGDRGRAQGPGGGSRKPTPRAARSHAKKEKLLSAYREQGSRGRQYPQLKGQPAVRRRGESRIECIAREIFQVRNRVFCDAL